MTLRVEVGKKGYIIIPKNVRELVGIKEGDTLILTVSGNRIILESEKRIDKEEIIKKFKEHEKKVSIKAKLGDLKGIDLEEEFES